MGFLFESSRGRPFQPANTNTHQFHFMKTGPLPKTLQPNAPTPLREEDFFPALTHLYLELQLPPQCALRAALADAPWLEREGDFPCLNRRQAP
jgi:hypothetical protein